MLKRFGFALSVGLASLSPALGAAAPLAVGIVTDSAHPIATPEIPDVTVTYYEIDKLDIQTAQLNAELASLTPLQAKAVANSYFVEHQASLRQGADTLSHIMQWQLTHFPAFVFDNGRAVIYGQISLLEAITEYQQWQNHQTA